MSSAGLMGYKEKCGICDVRYVKKMLWKILGISCMGSLLVIEEDIDYWISLRALKGLKSG